MGGRPSKATSKDMRLARNNPNAGKPKQPAKQPSEIKSFIYKNGKQVGK